jgi:hypothetical protein
MSEEKKEESNLSKCSKCQEIKLRKQNGFYPDGRNKRWENEDGECWIGRRCPSCVQSHMKNRMKVLRADRKIHKE